MQDLRYVFTDQSVVENWLKYLIQSDRWQTEPAQDYSETFFDTFDWRLYRNEEMLIFYGTEGTSSLSGCSLSGNLIAKIDSTGKPGFIQDLPPGKLSRHLQPLIKMRRLLPQATLHNRRQNLVLLNGNDKTVLRLQIATARVVEDSHGTRHPLSPQLQILPVKGYRSALKNLTRQLGNDPVLKPVSQNPLQEALSATGRRPADYSSKLELQLQPEQPAVRSLQTILLTLLQVIETNLEGLRADIDTEFLHDFRVAVRRTRSALSQLKGLLPPAEPAPFREEFGWLGSFTGPTRDLDVYLLKFENYRRLLPDSLRGDLDPFLRFLQQRRNREMKTMTGELNAPRFATLLSEWRAYLTREPEPAPALPDAFRPVGEVAGERIWKLFRKCLREGRAITAKSPAEALHEMRKTCKKLRYLLEFFRSLYPPDAMDILIKTLKGLQDNLGDIQDFQVQSGAIRIFALEMAEQNAAPPATLLAMGRLSENLVLQQQQVREEFYRRFANFSETDNSRLFRRLFKPPARKGGTDS